MGRLWKKLARYATCRSSLFVYNDSENVPPWLTYAPRPDEVPSPPKGHRLPVRPFTPETSKLTNLPFRGLRDLLPKHATRSLVVKFTTETINGSFRDEIRSVERTWTNVKPTWPCMESINYYFQARGTT